jgi:hypothetical protein
MSWLEGPESFVLEPCLLFLSSIRPFRTSNQKMCMDARRDGWNGWSQMAFDVGQIKEGFGRRNEKLDRMNVTMSKLTLFDCKNVI